jgi:predicted MFS family arabinose efflux permease
MIKSRSAGFYGWWVALTAALGLFLGSVPIMVFSFSVFLKPITQSFHSGRGAVSFAFTLHNFVVGISVPFAGWLIDRFGARRVILPSMVMVGLVLVLSKFCTGNIWLLYAFYAAVGFFGCGCGPLPYSRVVSHWFNRYRGLALGVMMLGLGLGAFIMPSLVQYLMARVGWQFTYGVVGAGALLVSLPVVATFLKDDPEEMGLLPDGVLSAPGAVQPEDEATNRDMSWYEAWHTGTFWLLMSSFMLVAASVHACFTQMAAILADRGSTAQIGALASSLLGSGVLIGRTGSGYLLDRFFGPHVAALIFAAAAAGMGLLRVGSSPELAFAAAFLIGLALGAEGDIIPYLTSRYFGLRSFGRIGGFTFAGFTLAGGLGAYVMGVAFDAKGSYVLPLVFCCLAALIGAALMMCVGPYRYGVEPGPEQSILELPAQV